MPKARYIAGRYDLLDFTDGEWTLRDEAGDATFVRDGGAQDTVEPQCERCGNYSTAVARVAATGRWVCRDGECLDAERGGA